MLPSLLIIAQNRARDELMTDGISLHLHHESVYFAAKVYCLNSYLKSQFAAKVYCLNSYLKSQFAAKVYCLNSYLKSQFCLGPAMSYCDCSKPDDTNDRSRRCHWHQGCRMASRKSKRPNESA